jgi:hypothetical protein
MKVAVIQIIIPTSTILLFSELKSIRKESGVLQVFAIQMSYPSQPSTLVMTAPSMTITLPYPQ